MHSFTRPALAVATAAVAVTALAGCSGGGTGGAEEPDVVEGGTFAFTLAADPGALDPQLSAVSSLFQLTQFAYDNLVSVNLDGEVESQLAKEWSVDGTTVTLTLNEGITCSDGSDFTAQTAADNIAWVADPANQSPLLGAFLPPGVTAAADGDTLTLTLAAPAPFVLQSLASLPMVCDAGLGDRAQLSAATLGTGPYALTEAVPNDHYTYELREGYTWGPNGAASDEKGLPETVVARVISNETTAANLLLAGDVNAAQIIGPDAARLEGADLFSQSMEAVLGEQWYNHSEGHVTSDSAVRMALTQAVDLDELQKVLTSGTGTASSRLTVVPPSACTFDAVSGNTPGYDVDAAKAALDAAGWIEGSDGVREKDGEKLAITFLYASTLGTGGTAAAELAAAAWQEVGFEVTATANDATTLTGVIFGTGAYDVAWVPLNVSNPDQVVGFVSGPAAPEGTNFSAIQNADYDAAVAEAMTLTGSDSCEKWEEAEAALFTAADLVLFGNSLVKMYGNGAEFVLNGSIVPMSVRMLAG